MTGIDAGMVSTIVGIAMIGVGPPIGMYLVVRAERRKARAHVAASIVRLHEHLATNSFKLDDEFNEWMDAHEDLHMEGFPPTSTVPMRIAKERRDGEMRRVRGLLDDDSPTIQRT